MRLRYELNADFRDGSAGARVRITSDDLARARKHAELQLMVAYGPGTIYTDGWRFVHSASPNADSARSPQLPPHVGKDGWLAMPVDAAISLRVMPDRHSAPPFVTLAEIARRTPPVMLYRPRLSRLEVELLIGRALLRRLWLVAAFYAALVLLVWLDRGAP